jgi:hypothetical protein
MPYVQFTGRKIYNLENPLNFIDQKFTFVKIITKKFTFAKKQNSPPIPFRALCNQCVVSRSVPCSDYSPLDSSQKSLLLKSAFLLAENFYYNKKNSENSRTPFLFVKSKNVANKKNVKILKEAKTSTHEDNQKTKRTKFKTPFPSFFAKNQSESVPGWSVLL